jgi:AAA+ superfamily predicted ATPase
MSEDSSLITHHSSLPPDHRGPSASLPAWYPAWAHQFADLFFSGTTCLFILHGNVHDLIHFPDRASDGYCDLPEFFADQLFAKWDLVVGYDLGRGLRPLAGQDKSRLRSMIAELSRRWGEPAQWPREPEEAMHAIDRLVGRTLVDDSGSRPSIGIVLDYAQYLVPAGDLGALSRGEGARLVKLLAWAQNPYIKRSNIAFCLVTDKLHEVNDRLVQNPHVAALELPLPDEKERERFTRWAARDRDFAELSELAPDQLAQLSNGLSLVSLNVLLSQGARGGRRVDAARFKALKKTLIERQCQGLIEFVQPSHTLETIVGHEAAKARLQEDAANVSRGRLDTAPMGYLICGPVGTGKTFLAECYAGSIGIPCVKLRNFRSKYVGQTEGNLEQILTVLRSLGPVVVIVDEADAALGGRHAEGDSGTSSRVFSMIASQMGDTRYRGRIIWMLLTCRPDLLPIDLKRQGRAEVHIPLFAPQTADELRDMFLAMARKNGVSLADDAVPTVKPERGLSGADVESIVLSANRCALLAGRSAVTADDLQQSLDDFVPSAQALEKDLQELAAALESTQLQFLPPERRKQMTKPDARAKLQERFVALRAMLE